MDGAIISLDWSSYNEYKRNKEQDIHLFSFNDHQECVLLIQAICKAFPDYSELLVLLAIHKTRRDRSCPCDRELFARKVLEDLQSRAAD